MYKLLSSLHKLCHSLQHLLFAFCRSFLSHTRSVAIIHRPCKPASSISSLNLHTTRMINCTFLRSDGDSYINKILHYTCSLVCVDKVNISYVNISPGLRGLSLFFIIQTLVILYNLFSQYLTNLMHKICFTISFISCLYMFRAHVLIIRRSKLHYTASGIIKPYRWPSRARNM